MTAPRRPANVRPRDRDEAAAGSLAPGRAEMETIEHRQAALAIHSGAELVADDDLGALLVIRPGLGPALNHATAIRWPRHRAEELLALLEQRFTSVGEWPSLVVSEGLTEPTDLPVMLAAAGWRVLLGERVMYTRHPPTVPHLDPGLRIEAVTRASATECVALETEVFGLAEAQSRERAEHLAAAIQRGELRAFMVRLRDEGVASARLATGSGVAGLYGIGVAARHRRRGYGSLVTAVATRAGLATGHKLVWLSVDEANTPAVELYKSLGFEPAFAWSRWAARSE